MTMNHQLYRELLPPLVYDDLSDEDRRFIEKHLETCEACRTELAQIRSLKALVTEHRPLQMRESDLSELRVERRMLLRRRPARTPMIERLVGLTGSLFTPPVRTALAGAFVLVIGFVGGLLVTRSQDGEGTAPAGLLQTAFPGAETNRSDLQITNFHFVDRDERSGQVEFTFDAVTPMRMRGNISDPAVQSILAHALVSDDNPGARLRAVNMIAGTAEQTPRVSSMSDDVKKALITALRYDRNLGVRKEALNVLQYYLPDPEATRAILDVLTTEGNTGMRIAAINALDMSKLSGRPAGKEVLDVFRQKLQSDENNYIRIRASAALKEARQ